VPDGEGEISYDSPRTVEAMVSELPPTVPLGIHTEYSIVSPSSRRKVAPCISFRSLVSVAENLNGMAIGASKSRVAAWPICIRRLKPSSKGIDVKRILDRIMGKAIFAER
jgi:hypothetical protein